MSMKRNLYFLLMSVRHRTGCSCDPTHQSALLDLRRLKPRREAAACMPAVPGNCADIPARPSAGAARPRAAYRRIIIPAPIGGLCRRETAMPEPQAAAAPRAGGRKSPAASRRVDAVTAWRAGLRHALINRGIAARRMRGRASSSMAASASRALLLRRERIASRLFVCGLRLANSPKASVAGRRRMATAGAIENIAQRGDGDVAVPFLARNGAR